MGKVKVLYISSASSEKTFFALEEKRKKTKFVYGMPVAANKFHNLIMKGLVHNNCDVTAITGLPVSLKTYNKLFIKKTKELENNINFINLGFINLPVLKQLKIGFSCFVEILKWNRKNKNFDQLIIFDASYVSIIPFITLANFFVKKKTIPIFADIYDYMADVDAKNTNYKLINKVFKRIMRFCYNKNYGYIFLSEQMNDLINKNVKPYCVIEGLADSSVLSQKKKNSGNNKKIIMYAGALRKEYGLEMLLDGFMLYKNENVELWIYGSGDYENEILEKCKIDNRIKYKGIKPNKQIVEAEKKADLLVNPRPSDLEFTKYSFPSKLIEYMSSGTAVLTTKLPTIPKDYYNYLYFIEKENKQGVCDAISNIFKKSQKNLSDDGMKTQRFILENKTEIKQTEKILNSFRSDNDEKK